MCSSTWRTVFILAKVVATHLPRPSRSASISSLSRSQALACGGPGGTAAGPQKRRREGSLCHRAVISPRDATEYGEACFIAASVARRHVFLWRRAKGLAHAVVRDEMNRRQR